MPSSFLVVLPPRMHADSFLLQPHADSHDLSPLMYTSPQSEAHPKTLQSGSAEVEVVGSADVVVVFSKVVVVVVVIVVVVVVVTEVVVVLVMLVVLVMVVGSTVVVDVVIVVVVSGSKVVVVTGWKQYSQK